jgi:hypothetical protein
LDGTGSAYVTGRTWSNDFPTTPSAFDTSHNGNDDVFLARLDPAGSGLVYATFLGGSGDESAHGVAVDATGNAFVTGGTLSGDFPTTPNAFDPSYNGSVDAFVAKLNTETALGDQPVWLPIVLRQR